MTNALESISTLGGTVTYVGPELPFAWQVRAANPINHRWRALALVSGAIRPDGAVSQRAVLFLFELCDELVQAAREASKLGYMPILWGHYIFPYGSACLMAAEVLRAHGVQYRVWLTPAGSDVWELGAQLASTLRGILTDARIDRLITYSSRFAAEVRRAAGKQVEVDVVAPPVQAGFVPVAPIDRLARKARLGFDDKEFVISFHCNMRPVKAPNHVVDLARRVAAMRPSEPVTLVMAGPCIPLEPACSTLNIRQLGVVARPWEILQAADLEVNLSTHDSFNMSLAEAMACGVPVLTTDVVGIGDLITTSGAGVVVGVDRSASPRGRYPRAVMSILELWRSPARRGAIGRAGARCAAESLSGKTAGERYLTLATAKERSAAPVA